VASGFFTLTLTKTLEEIASTAGNKDQTCVITLREALSHLPELFIEEAACKRLKNGIAPSLSDVESNSDTLPASGLVKIIFRDDLVAVCASVPSEAGTLRIERVFNQFSPLQHSV
jgi:tRNA U55 pseudouridine synthase TruB